MRDFQGHLGNPRAKGYPGEYLDYRIKGVSEELKIDELIRKQCPQGVKYVKLGDLVKNKTISMGRGQIISKETIEENPGDYPVYSSSAVYNGVFGKTSSYMFDDERITWSIDGGGGDSSIESHIAIQ